MRIVIKVLKICRNFETLVQFSRCVELTPSPNFSKRNLSCDAGPSFLLRMCKQTKEAFPGSANVFKIDFLRSRIQVVNTRFTKVKFKLGEEIFDLSIILQLTLYLGVDG